MVSKPCLALLVVMAAGAMSMTTAAQPPSVETLLGIVDERGVLTPVIRFDGIHWRNTWPEPDQKIADVTLPSSLAAIPRAWTGYPVPARWYAWPHGAAIGPNGAAVRPIQVKGPERYDASCIPGIGLRADLPPPPRVTPTHTWPKQKQAIAVSSAAVRIEPINTLRVSPATRPQRGVVQPDTPAEQDVLRAAETPFRVLARKAVSEGKNPVKLAAWPISWRNAWRYALADSNAQVYLVEGEISHELWPGTVTGFLWLKVRDGIVAEHRGRAVLNDEDFKMTVHHFPLGVVRIGGHHFWVGAQLGYEHEVYLLIDLTSPTLPEVLQASGGGC
jgi:hypothetical protein